MSDFNMPESEEVDLEQLMKEKEELAKYDLEQVKKECEEASLELVMEAEQQEAKERYRQAAIENLECLARLLDRLPVQICCDYKLTGFGNYPSRVIYGAVDVLKNNN